MNYFMECVFEGPWEYRAGADYQPGPAVVAKPPVSSFDNFRESNRVLGRAPQVPGPKFSPEESAKKMETAPDLQADLVLHEPAITQPFCRTTWPCA